MHLFHIPQCSIQNRNVHISVLNGALWDMEQVHSGICELGHTALPWLKLCINHNFNSTDIVRPWGSAMIRCLLRYSENWPCYNDSILYTAAAARARSQRPGLLEGHAGWSLWCRPARGESQWPMIRPIWAAATESCWITHISAVMRWVMRNVNWILLVAGIYARDWWQSWWVTNSSLLGPGQLYGRLHEVALRLSHCIC